ncbi:hypothetical protein CASFOL_038028 [Castilleja foliolosa]|uniref:Rosmarinate synthase n=1 Tax=Castilleja foliolosa TaxID=1961234 RepID=A0ABD3BKA6_9LAMI
MKINVTNSTMVKPMSAKPCTSLWISNLDALFPTHYHTRTLYFFRSNGAANFFDPVVVKAALSRALALFYPVAGRLRRDENNRIEINCNGEGALFVVAEADGEMDDLGGFGPRPEIGLVPMVDYSKGMSTYPLQLLQMTRFKCGGVCLGLALDHHVCDGYSALQFINTWSDIARGLDVTVSPIIDRTALRARSQLNPKFPHVEYQPAPSIKTLEHNVSSETTFAMFKLTRDQLDALKAKCNNDENQLTKYTSYVTLAAHVWRCISATRGLSEYQETNLYISVDGRSKLRPTLARGFFGNVIFPAAAVASCGELKSNGLRYAAKIIHDTLSRMDDEYLRSALDYLEMLPCDISDVGRGPHTYKSPNLGIISWARLPFYDADFGWGKPVYVGPGAPPCEGKSYVLRSSADDTGLVYAISLPKEQVKLFEELFYDI